MSGKSKIEWTDVTWNPLRGCSLVSDGCKNCYAMKQAHRYSGPGKAYEGLTEIGPDGPRWNGQVRLIESELEKPLRWKRPRKIFVNSMSDLFHEAVPFEFIDKVLAVIALCPQHTFIVLTKRPERMAEYFERLKSESPPPMAGADELDRIMASAAPFFGHRVGEEQWMDFMSGDWPLPNLWLGVSVENQKTVDERIPKLLNTPAAIRFVSAEPALGPICFLKMWLNPGPCGTRCGLGSVVFPFKKMPQIDWIIVGGESGPGARPSHPDWFRKVRDDCQAAGVPFFFKQWGKWAPHPYPPTKGKNTGAGIFMRTDGTWGNQGEFWDGEAQAMDKHKNKKAAGDFLDGKQYHQFPEVG